MLGALRSTVKDLARPVYRFLRERDPFLFSVRIEDPRRARFDFSPIRPARDASAECMKSPGPEAGQSFVGYDAAKVQAVLDQIASFDGKPGVDVLDDVVYMPRWHRLFGGDGRQIEISHCRVESRPTPERIEVPLGLPVFDGEVAYVGPLSNHYGHFVSESIGRLWYANEDPAIPLLTHELDRFSTATCYLDHFFQGAELAPGRLFAFDRPTRLRRVVLPRPSFLCSPRREVHACHRLIPQTVARNLLPVLPETTDQPVYLSRRKLPAQQRKVLGEETLESELRRAGCAIVAPEDLSFPQQIECINRHKTVVACLGSALHSFVFDRSPDRNLIAFAYRDAPHPNYLMMDALMAVHSTYVAALDEDDRSTKDYSHRDRVLDLDLAFEILRRENIL